MKLCFTDRVGLAALIYLVTPPHRPPPPGRRQTADWLLKQLMSRYCYCLLLFTVTHLDCLSYSVASLSSSSCLSLFILISLSYLFSLSLQLVSPSLLSCLSSSCCLFLSLISCLSSSRCLSLSYILSLFILLYLSLISCLFISLSLSLNILPNQFKKYQNKITPFYKLENIHYQYSENMGNGFIPETNPPNVDLE